MFLQQDFRQRQPASGAQRFDVWSNVTPMVAGTEAVLWPAFGDRIAYSDRISSGLSRAASGCLAVAFGARVGLRQAPHGTQRQISNLRPLR